MCERGAPRALGRGGRRPGAGVLRWVVSADRLRRVALALFGLGICFAVEGHAADDVRPVDGTAADGTAADGTAETSAAQPGTEEARPDVDPRHQAPPTESTTSPARSKEAPAAEPRVTEPRATESHATEPRVTEPRVTEPSLVWQPEWRRFGWWNAAVLGAAAGTALVALAVGPDEADPRRWTWAVDEDVRSWARADSASGRRASRRVSDVAVALEISYAFVGDAILNAGVIHQSPDVAWQLALIDAQVLALSLGAQLATATWVSRERPYVRDCAGEATTQDGSSCTGGYRYRSFYSGHTSTAFAMAAATCTHHAHLPLYGRGVRWVPCAGSLAAGAVAGAARIVGDHHFLTDVLVGAAAGSAIGWLVPWLHYRAGKGPAATPSSSQRGPRAGGLQVIVVPNPRGLEVIGSF